MTVVSSRPVFFSYNDHLQCHRIRLVLAEKDISHDLIIIHEGEDKPEDLAHLNPYNTVPFLVDREVRLFEPGVIISYLDERFGNNPLYAQQPQHRAQQRQNLWQIEHDWFKHAERILLHPDTFNSAEAAEARLTLSKTLMQIAEVFNEQPYFLSNTFSVLDCTLIPLLWRFEKLDLKVPVQKIAPIARYLGNMLKRESVQKSLTASERFNAPKAFLAAANQAPSSYRKTYY